MSAPTEVPRSRASVSRSRRWALVMSTCTRSLNMCISYAYGHSLTSNPERPSSEEAALQLEVALDRRDGEALGGHVDGVHATLAQDRERSLTRVAHVFRDDLLEQLLGRARPS